MTPLDWHKHLSLTSNDLLLDTAYERRQHGSAAASDDDDDDDDGGDGSSAEMSYSRAPLRQVLHHCNLLSSVFDQHSCAAHH